MGLRYSDVETFVKSGLVALGYASGNPNEGEVVLPMPAIDPGPFTIERLRKKYPHSVVFLVVGSGAGLSHEALYDRPFITVRTIGQQNNYDHAEKLAYDVDDILLGAVNGVTLGSARTLYVSRTGGAPQAVDFDDAERYHFQATYITEAAR